MLFLIQASLIATAAAAESEISSRDGGLNMRVGRQDGDALVTRTMEETASIFAMSRGLAAVQSSLADGTVNDMINRVMADTTSRTIDMVTNNAELTAEVSSLRATMTTQQAAMTAMLAQVNNQLAAAAATATTQAASASAAAAAARATATTEQSRAGAALAASVAAALSAAASTSTASNNALTAASSSAIRILNASVVSSLANVMPKRTHVWRGGCSARRHGGWHWFCLDRVAFDSAAPYFRKSSSTRHTSLMNVVMHISFFSLGTSCNNQHNYLTVNGAEWSNTHSHTFYSNWMDSHSIDTLRIPRGQWWGVRSHAACGHVTTHEYGARGQWAHYESVFIGTY